MGMELKVKRNDCSRLVAKCHREMLSSVRCLQTAGGLVAVTVARASNLTKIIVAFASPGASFRSRVSASRFRARARTRARQAGREPRVSPRGIPAEHLRVVGNDNRTIRCCRTRARATPPMTHAHLLVVG